MDRPRKQVLALLLCVILCVTMFPVDVLAGEDHGELTGELPSEALEGAVDTPAPAPSGEPASANAGDSAEDPAAVIPPEGEGEQPSFVVSEDTSDSDVQSEAENSTEEGTAPVIPTERRDEGASPTSSTTPDKAVIPSEAKDSPEEALTTDDQSAAPQENTECGEEEIPGEETANESTGATIASGTCGDNLTWTLDENGVLVISGTGNMENYGYFFKDLLDYRHTPWYDYRGKIYSVKVETGVTSIGTLAFYQCYNMASVTIQEGVTIIGSGAFCECNSLMSVTIPLSLESIGYGSFFKCNTLSSVIYTGTIIHRVRIITWEDNDCLVNAAWVYYGTEYPSGTCGEGLTWIINEDGTLTISGNGSMEDYGSASSPWSDYCNVIKIINISSGVTHIGNYAFELCHRLTQVEIPSGVNSIGHGAFYECDFMTSVLIPEGVSTIGDYAFYGCTRLESITIPSSVESIAQGTFNECRALTTIIFGHKAGDPLTIQADSFGLINLTIATTVYVPNVNKINNTIQNYNWSRDHRNVIFDGENEPVEETVWSDIDQPYVLTSDMVVNKDTSLSITPGATVEGNGYRIIVFGNLNAHGAIFDNVSIVIGATKESAPASISITGCSYNGGSLLPPTGNASYATIEIRNNYFSNLSGYSYIWYPQGITYITGNTFDHCGGISVGSDFDIYITNNLFFNHADISDHTGHDFVIEDWVQYNNSHCYVEYNSFHENCTVLYLEYDDSNIQAANNYWFTTDESVIAKRVGHNLEYNDGSGLVYLPILTSAHPSTPVLPQHASGTVVRENEIAATFETEGSYDEVVYCTICGEEISRETKAIPRINQVFTDVTDSSAYFYEPVYWAYANNITTGTSPTTFSPQKACTRGQIVTFLWRMMGCPEPTSSYNPFRDVRSTDYYYKPVLWARARGITTGTSATVFSPNAACTRGQCVTFLWRAAGSPEPVSRSNPFKDVKASDYFYKAVLWAKENNITTGTSATTFSPNKSCTRGQIVTFLYRYAQMNG